MIFGVDTASVAGNKNPNWAQAKAAGPINFALLRATFGDAEDKAFKREWPRVKEAGLVRGGYFFLRFPRGGKAIATPENQAKAMIAVLGALGADDLPPALDVEFPGRGRVETGLSAAECLSRIVAAATVLTEHYGFPPIIYTSGRVWREDLANLPAPELAESPLWLARYFFKMNLPAKRDPAAFDEGRLDPPVPGPLGDAANWWLHQFQGDAHDLPGFSGKVDMNRFNATLLGARGDRVKWVQRRLKLQESGAFDAATSAAVRAFQNVRGLVADGVVGPRTFAHLAKINA